MVLPGIIPLEKQMMRYLFAKLSGYHQMGLPSLLESMMTPYYLEICTFDYLGLEDQTMGKCSFQHTLRMHSILDTIFLLVVEEYAIQKYNLKHTSHWLVVQYMHFLYSVRQDM